MLHSQPSGKHALAPEQRRAMRITLPDSEQRASLMIDDSCHPKHAVLRGTA